MSKSDLLQKTATYARQRGRIAVAEGKNYAIHTRISHFARRWHAADVPALILGSQASAHCELIAPAEGRYSNLPGGSVRPAFSTTPVLCLAEHWDGTSCWNNAFSKPALIG